MKAAGKYLWGFLLVGAVAFAVQYALIGYVPNLLYKVATVVSAKPYNTLIHAPRTDARLRKVVLPNPDFIYSAVFYDVSESDLILTGEFPDTSQYACIAFYGNDLQPYHVVNNQLTPVKNFRFNLTTSATETDDKFSVHAKTKKGSVLIRMLVTDSAQLMQAIKIQQSLSLKKVQ